MLEWLDDAKLPQLPLRAWVDNLIAWMNNSCAELFYALASAIDSTRSWIDHGLLWPHPAVLVGIIAAPFLLRRDWGTALMVVASMLLIWNLGLWRDAVDTLSLVLVSSTIALALALPVGALVGESSLAKAWITPLLDYMQTTPAFVYLIPSVLFFGVGYVPGVVATVLFAFPPPVRATALGIEEVDPRLVEAARAFGAGRTQILWKIKLPLAANHIALGINQCIMMSLTMVVIASLIGARGLGTRVVEALNSVDIGLGVEAGTAVVLIALILDRLTRAASRRRWRGR